MVQAFGEAIVGSFVALQQSDTLVPSLSLAGGYLSRQCTCVSKDWLQRLAWQSPSHVYRSAWSLQAWGLLTQSEMLRMLSRLTCHLMLNLHGILVWHKCTVSNLQYCAAHHGLAFSVHDRDCWALSLNAELSMYLTWIVQGWWVSCTFSSSM